MTQTTVTQGALSVQLYTVRDAIAADLPEALGRLADIGFENVEPFGFVERAEGYRLHLAANGLVAPSAHASLVGVDLEPVFAAATALGIETVIDPYVDPERWTTREGVAGVAADLSAASSAAAAHGLRVGYHNHAFELENQIDGRTALEVFADLLDDSVLLELDTYWAAVGGQNVPELLARLGGRVRFLHVKDGPISKVDTEQTAVGDGRMPVAEILEANPTALRVIELDAFDGDVFDALTASFAHLTPEGHA
ncbi:MAG: hypothetical protein RI885_1284 [Actinomycetota bacterium]|jgi:sugar phosphate isomerase/epimerase